MNGPTIDTFVIECPAANGLPPARVTVPIYTRWRGLALHPPITASGELSGEQAGTVYALSVVSVGRRIARFAKVDSAMGAMQALGLLRDWSDITMDDATPELGRQVAAIVAKFGGLGQ